MEVYAGGLKFQDAYFLYHRYRGISNKTSDRIARSASFLKPPVRECRLPDCSISPVNGYLTIAKLLLDYEGWYTCKKSGDAIYFEGLEGLHYVNVSVNGRLFSVVTPNVSKFILEF